MKKQDWVHKPRTIEIKLLMVLDQNQAQDEITMTNMDLENI